MKSFLKKYAECILSSLASFFAPIAGILTATAVMVFADLITGVKAASKQGESFSWSKIGNTLTKCSWYYLAIILAFLMQTIFGAELPIVKIIASSIAAEEFKSNIRNFKVILGLDFSAIIKNYLNKDKE